MEVLAGEDGLGRLIRIARIQKPGLALAGFLDQLHPERVQILGETEISYLSTLDPHLAFSRLESLCAAQVSCIIIAKALEPTPGLVDLCRQYNLPLLRSREISSTLIRKITTYLEDLLAPETSMHGCLVDVSGVGIILQGKSGIGKSECALGLIERGHRLVGDDLVIIKRKVPGVLFGSAADMIRYHMEIRGLGIINIKDLFGVSSIRHRKKVELVVELVEWEDGTDVERLGLDEHTFAILGVELPYLRIPVRPARDLRLIIEMAARNHLLKRMGYNAAVELSRELSRRMTREEALVDKPDVGPVE